MKTNRKLCGLRPTGRLHLGHYFAVIEPALARADVLIANYHAPQETSTDAIIDTLQRFRVNPLHIVRQADVFNAALYFRLLSLAPIGRLERMTQYKSAPDASRSAHLLTYPVLMAHDVAGYDTVLVGEDQQQHLEYARDLLERYNAASGECLTIPVAQIVAGRVRDLRQPLHKMSKSAPAGCLFLDDSADSIRSKLRAAVMDEAGTENMHWLYRRFVGGDPPASNQFLKEQLAEALIANFTNGAVSQTQ